MLRQKDEIKITLDSLPDDSVCKNYQNLLLNSQDGEIKKNKGFKNLLRNQYLNHLETNKDKIEQNKE